VTISPVDDGEVEADETVVVTLQGSPAYTVGGAASATVSIVSDDVALPTVTVAATDATAHEAGGGAGVVTVTRSGSTSGALAVSYTVGGTAAGGSDYAGLAGSVTIGAGAATATVTISPVDDGEVEADETVVVTLQGSPAYTVGGAASATVTIVSDDVALSKQQIVTASGSEGLPQVVGYVESETSPSVVTMGTNLMAYDPAFRGGVFVAQGDLDGDGVPEIITGTGVGGGPHVRTYRTDNRDFGVSFLAYPPAFVGGIRVAACDVDGDGRAEIITAAGPGGGPHIRVWRLTGLTPSEVVGFFAYEPSFGDGVFVGCGDLDGDGVAEILTAPGAGGGPHVRAWRLNGGDVSEVLGFLAYDPHFTGGVFVAAGDVDGDARAEIITGTGPGGGPHIRVWGTSDGGGLFQLVGFMAYAPQFLGGVRVAAGDVDGDGLADIITGAGPGGGPHVQTFSVAGPEVTNTHSFFAYSPSFTGGIFVAGFQP
jgi:hypothetical protein